MAIDLSTLTFTNQADIVPTSGTAEIINNGTANTLGGDDKITGTSTSSNPGISNSASGAINTGGGNDSISGTSTSGIGFGGFAIGNTGIIDGGDGNDSISGIGFGRGIKSDSGIIDGGDGNDSISGTAISGAGIGISNNGSTIAGGNGNDSISGKSSTGVGVGILNNSGTINAGNGNDSISGIGFGSEGVGILNSSIILGGNGDDTITGSGKFIGISSNDGTIDTGNGEDIVDALVGGFRGNGTTSMGNGSDIVKGYGTGRFDGGNGPDTLLYPPATYTVSSNINNDGYYTVTNQLGRIMLVKNFETIGSANNPANTFSFASVIGQSFPIN